MFFVLIDWNLFNINLIMVFLVIVFNLCSVWEVYGCIGNVVMMCGCEFFNCVFDRF